MKRTSNHPQHLNDAIAAAMVQFASAARRYYNHNASADNPTAVEDAIRAGFTAAVNTPAEWDTETAIKTARAILEGANCHAEAQTLSESMP